MHEIDLLEHFIKIFSLKWEWSRLTGTSGVNWWHFHQGRIETLRQTSLAWARREGKCIQDNPF